MSWEDHELTTIQYARQYGLAVDHLLHPLPTSHIEVLGEKVPEALTDESDLLNIDTQSHISIQETLALDKCGAELLQGVSNGPSTSSDLESILFPLLDTRQAKKLRIEIPLLRTDHASDFSAFARWEESHFRDGCLPMEPLDDEMDLGLVWPRRLEILPIKLLRELESEKAEMLKDSLIYLQATLKGTWTEEDDKEMWEGVTSYKRNTALEPVTPPLLPLSPPSTPYIPSSPACHLPLLSDPASLTDEDLRNAEEAIFEQESLGSAVQCSSSFTNLPATVAGSTHVIPSDVFLPSNFLESNEDSPFSMLEKPEDRKVEVPLMPATPAPTLPKIVTFSEVVEEMLLDSVFKRDASESAVSVREVDTYFREAFGDAAENANRSIEQEQLQEADAKNRVQVPVMDFNLPNPPWKLIQAEGCPAKTIAAQKAIVANIQEIYGLPLPWPGVNKLNLKLRWTVFPSELAKSALDESFGDDEELHTFLEHFQNQQVLDSHGLTWKPPGLRILKENDESEDDLEIGHFDAEKSHDVAALVKKRKIQYEEENSKYNVSANTLNRRPFTGDPVIENTAQSRNPGDKLTSNLPENIKTTRDKFVRNQREEMNPIFNSHFSASDALDNFLEIRVSKKQKPAVSEYFAGPSIENPCPKPLPETLAKPAPAMLPQIPQKQLPIPSGDPSLVPTPYIISSAILKNRTLIRILGSIFPAAVQIERDFTAYNRTAWLPNSITRSPVISPLDSEADFIISPSTGIIITTLQKIKQKPLPGQKSKPAFKERIGKVSMRYERLVVLVSEASADTSTDGLTETDVLALAEVTGFCSSLDTSVIMHFVGGGEVTLAKWLVAVMIRYGSQGESSIPLLQDETTWELFLRRAGMNAYAAQAVIAELKAPDGVDAAGGSKAGLFGITAFVEMDQQERISRFEQLLGGRRVLQRVGRVLDANWA